MSIWTLLILAVGLSADAFAVALGKGLRLRRDVSSAALILGGAFGLAQGAMPVTGWFLGSTFADHVSGFAPWIAFVLLAAVGIKMLHESLTASDGDTEPGREIGSGGAREPANGHGLKASEVIVLAIATSIDALAVGVSMAVLDVSIWWASAVIGVVTFTLATVAVYIGHTVGTRFRTPAEVLGGLILVGIGISVLLG